MFDVRKDKIFLLKDNLNGKFQRVYNEISHSDDNKMCCYYTTEYTDYIIIPDKALGYQIKIGL